MNGPEFDTHQEAQIKKYGLENDSCPKCGGDIFIIAVENPLSNKPMLTCCNPKCNTQWTHG